jgi:hypothetical protein
LLGGFVAERTRRCDIMFPDWDTVTFGLAGDAPFLVSSLGSEGSVGGMAFPSVGVGGVTSVVGASIRFGGAAGSWVIMRLGAVERRDGVDRAWSPEYICGGEACSGSSKTLVSRFFPPNNVPSPPPLVLGLAVSGVPTDLGDADLRLGVKASFSLPTGDGDTPLLPAAVSRAFACRMDASSVEVTESAKVPSVVDAIESMVSEAIRGEDRVRSPECDGCGEMPGLLAGRLMFG